nr:hypothetical protein [uncultured Hyphomonas sp.]
MVCDIFTRAQKRDGGVWTDVAMRPVFQDSGYALFGFLANVRNYSAVPPISQPRGLPAGIELPPEDEFDENEVDVPKGYLGDHSFSWISIEELLAFDYEQAVENRRVSRQFGRIVDHGVTAEPGAGRMTTYRDLLGPAFFFDLIELQERGVERVVFGFND